MQENNFEKQVQNKMAELRLQPAGEVWNRVALVIEKRRRKWRLMLLFILFAITTGGLAIWTYTTNRNLRPLAADKKLVQPLKTNESQSAKANKQPTQINTSTQSTISGDKSETLLTQSSSTKKINADTALDIKLQPKKVQQGQLTLNEGTKQQILPANKKGKSQPYRQSTNAITTTSIIQAEVDELSESESEMDKTYLVGLDKKNETPENSLAELSFIYVPIKPISAAQLKYLSQVKISTTKLVFDTNAFANNHIQKNNSKKTLWQFGANFSIGISTTRSSYLGVGTNEDASKAADQVGAINSPANGGGGNITYYPAPVKLNTAFVAGGYVQKSIGRNKWLLAGINYHYLSTKINIGKRIDSTGIFSNQQRVEYFYRAGSTTKYTNRYHFIEIPVGILIRLSKKQTALPIYGYAGITVSRLIQTNALQFSQSAGAYFIDNSIFNKTQIGLDARLLFTLQKHSAHPVMIGPHLKYSFIKMADIGFYNNRHYSFLGIQVQRAIGKK